ncbi:MAG: hypothetical protein PHC99_08140 [Methylococcales bacterium]|nr:hypothetical protein [Methylococcales bacterium]
MKKIDYANLKKFKDLEVDSTGMYYSDELNSWFSGEDEYKSRIEYLQSFEEKPKENKTQKKYIQQEIDGMKKRGGWRGGGRPKSTGQTTVAVRIDKRLEILVNALKESLKNGTLDENEIELLLMRTQKQKSDL